MWYFVFPLGHFIRQKYSLDCLIGALAKNIIRSPILEGKITSYCGPLGRHNRATMFCACSLTIIYMETDETKRFVSVNSPIQTKGMYNKLRVVCPRPQRIMVRCCHLWYEYNWYCSLQTRYYIHTGQYQ